jgi:mitochondrial fission protein ELM1
VLNAAIQDLETHGVASIPTKEMAILAQTQCTFINQINNKHIARIQSNERLMTKIIYTPIAEAGKII